jgi:hypothetical protein
MQMATTPIGNGSAGLAAAEITRFLSDDLIVTLGRDKASKSGNTGEAIASAASGSQATAVARAASSVAAGAAVTPVSDMAAALVSEVATSDLAKLSQILSPAAPPDVARLLDSLMGRAVQEIAAGNPERAIGYLADFATRDPQRAETLLSEPGLEPIRAKVDAMLNRMTVVARMTAETGLSEAEQSASDVTGKLPAWDTSPQVLLKIAHSFYEVGGYANYNRTADIARTVASAIEAVKPQPLAISASAAAGELAAPSMVPGVTIPYLPMTEIPIIAPPGDLRFAGTMPRRRQTLLDDVAQNWRDLKAISTGAIRQLWMRAPLLVMMLTWLWLGFSGGVAYAIGSRIWPDSLFSAAGDLAFALWGLGFLALVIFGFYARVKYRPVR